MKKLNVLSIPIVAQPAPDLHTLDGKQEDNIFKNLNTGIGIFVRVNVYAVLLLKIVRSICQKSFCKCNSKLCLLM